jgi:hypothetical protein
MSDERENVLKKVEEEAPDTAAEAEVEAHTVLKAQDAPAADDEGEEPDVEAHTVLK